MLLFILFPILLSQTQFIQTQDFNSSYIKKIYYYLYILLNNLQLPIQLSILIKSSLIYCPLSFRNLFKSLFQINQFIGQFQQHYKSSMQHHIHNLGEAFPIQSIVVQMIQGTIIDVFWDNVSFDGGQQKQNLITKTIRLYCLGR